MNRSFVKIFKEYQEITVRYDEPHQAIWYYFSPTLRPCFSLKMLQEIRDLFQGVTDYFLSRNSDSEPPIRYLILTSQIPGIFNLGGDLALFSQLIKAKNRQQLLSYAKLCVELCYLNSVSLHLPITTMSLVEGIALGGGFESAMASNILIATEHAEMGLPEIRFNLFPGMGAYSFLARTCGMLTAEKMITSGQMYTARQLHDMGIVNAIVSAENAQESVEKFIRRHRQSGNGRRAIQLASQRYHPINHQELIDITEIWVDAALRLQDRDLRMMDRLVKAQFRKMSKQKESFVRTRQDRRFYSENISFPFTDWSGETILCDRRLNRDRRGHRKNSNDHRKNERRQGSNRLPDMNHQYDSNRLGYIGQCGDKDRKFVIQV
jgi:DSF synthase